jgi:pimeloyl-ACP methyl ester carboxylesterase
MHDRVWPRLLALAGVLLLLAGCDLATATPTPVPPPPTATAVPPTPTRVPPPPPREVSFTTEDGVTLKATLYGSGPTAVVLSHMNRSNRGTWKPLAERLAAQGYLVLAYDFRGQGESDGRNTPTKIDTDLRAAIAFARAQGATTLVLGGASLGGMATGLVAAQEQAAAFFIMSSPRSALGVDVTDDRFQGGAAKLFLNTEGDLYNADIHQMYAVAAPPKEEQYYPGKAHGVEMFDQEYGPTVLDRIVSFIRAHAPPG